MKHLKTKPYKVIVEGVSARERTCPLSSFPPRSLALSPALALAHSRSLWWVWLDKLRAASTSLPSNLPAPTTYLVEAVGGGLLLYKETVVLKGHAAPLQPACLPS